MCDLREVYWEQGFEEGLTKGEAIGIKKGEAIGLTKGEAIGLKRGEAIGIKKGEAMGLKRGEAIGLTKAIAILLKLNYEDTFILSKICETFDVSQTEALDFLNAVKAGTE